MVFSSYIFLYCFLPLALLAYYATPRPAKSLTLTLVSFIFYGWWRPLYVVLMLVPAILDYGAGILITRDKAGGRSGGRWLLLSVCMNLGLLGWFKYSNFGVGAINDLVVALGGKAMAWDPVTLPVGISFFTFQTMSYTINVYRGHVQKAARFVDFLCYVAMFPQLVAGPVVRYVSVADQLQNREHTLGKFVEGVVLMQLGLAKKLLIADVLGQVAGTAFAATGLATPHAWIGLLCYTFQIYFDFSGYSDIAIGLALMLGFRFPINFNQPYRAISITDFWRRWHVSLSTWLRDYLYVSLGGNRRGTVRTYVNLMLTMLLGGLWHGANWTFIAWGAYQGAWLVIERLAGRRALWWFLPRPLQMALTFVAAMIGWVFFRAASLHAAIDYLGWLFGHAAEAVAPLTLRPIHLAALVGGAFVTWFLPTTQSVVSRMSSWSTLLAQPAFAAALLQLHFSGNVPFLYFQF